MPKLPRFFSSALLFFILPIFAQQPAKPTSVDIYNQIRKLNFLGSVLYIAAHPDDENTRLISYFSNHIHARTSYLSLTRGDGGQNLVGPELRELLGVIRTQELIEARKIDGGEQFLTRANDFGYSKNPEETLTIWEKDLVLSDVILAIRRFRPDIIVNRFDSRSPGTTHGHHTTSAMLSLDAFEMAADQKAFPAHFTETKPWKPSRVFFNTSWWFYGGKEKFEKADKSMLYNIETGVYFETLGKSNQEIAALSRSCHRSQGFGTTGTRGGETEFLELIKGDAPTDRNNLFEGIDTSWNRVKGGKTIGVILDDVEKNFDFKNPAGSIPELLKAYSLILALDDDHWKRVKSAEIKNIIAACAGLYLEAVSDVSNATPGSVVQISAESINRSNQNVTLQSITALPGNRNIEKNVLLQNNTSEHTTFELPLPSDLQYSQPYWLRSPSNGGTYAVQDQKLIGTPDIERHVKVVFNMLFDGMSIPFERNVIYKYNDDAKGEIYEPFDIVPEVSLSFLDKVTLFTSGKRTKNISVRIQSSKDSVSGSVRLDLPAGWKSVPASVPFSIKRKGTERSVEFEITAPTQVSETTVRAIATIGTRDLDKEKVEIKYDHISRQIVLMPAEARFLRPDLKIQDEKIGYIMGAGDEVDKGLQQMGYTVTSIKPEEISNEKLAEFDVIVIGIRAYNKLTELGIRQNLLLDFVKDGQTMIVQYNTLDELTTKEMSPYPLKISRDRVTDERAEVRFLAPQHSVLNYPNKITSADFSGWKQELGLYFPNQWDPAFTPILSANDKNEDPKNGALLVAKYGKGHYIYTGLSFFRQFPEGVTGAFRLMANLISL